MSSFILLQAHGVFVYHQSGTKWGGNKSRLLTGEVRIALPWRYGFFSIKLAFMGLMSLVRPLTPSPFLHAYRECRYGITGIRSSFSDT